MPKRARPLVLRLVPVLDFGGVESRIVLQANAASTAGYDLRVACFWKPGAAAEAVRATGVQVDVLGFPPTRKVSTIARLARYFAEVRPDVVHCSITEANFVGLIASHLARVPVRIAEEVGMPSHTFRARMAFAALYRTSASTVVGVTQAVCDYVHTVDMTPESKIRRIYNCAHPRFFPTPRKPLARGQKNRRLLMVGRLHPVKNHETVFRAFARVHRDFPEVVLRVAGDGLEMSRLKQLRRSLDLDDSIELLGYRADIDDLLADADAFILSSHDEGCSISLIEAMASGLPSLGSDVPGISEVMGDALCASWTVPAADIDGWERLMTQYLSLSPTERAEAATQFQTRAYDAFSPSRYLRDLEQLYADHTRPRGASLTGD